MIPFQNMVYIGNCATDVPCFRLDKDMGGLSVVAFKPHTKGARDKGYRFIQDGRLFCAVPAEYTEGKELDRIANAQTILVAARELRDHTLRDS